MGWGRWGWKGDPFLAFVWETGQRRVISRGQAANPPPSLLPLGLRKQEYNFGPRVCATPSLPRRGHHLRSYRLRSGTTAGADSLTECPTSQPSRAGTAGSRTPPPAPRRHPLPAGQARGRPHLSHPALLPPTPAAGSSSLTYAASTPAPPWLPRIPITGVGVGGHTWNEGQGEGRGERERTRQSGSQEPGRKWQDPAARPPHTRTRSPTRPRFNAKCLQDGRQEGGGVEGRPGVTGSGIRRAEDASGTAKVRKSQTPTVSIPKSRLPCLPPGSSSF